MRRAPLRVAAPLALAALLVSCKPRNHYVAPPPPQVSVAVPLRQPITRYLETTGSTAPVNQVQLVARIEGFLQDITYIDGSFVKRGTNLFTIEPLPYQAKLQQAQAAEQGAQATLTNADQEYQRQASLGKNDFASQSTVQQNLATRDNARAALAQDQANTRIAAINYSYTRVAAPFDGVVSAHQVSVGELVGNNSATTLATIVQLDPIYVTFNVNEQDVQRIRAQMLKRGITQAELAKVPVQIGLQSEQGYPHAGTLDYIAPSMDSSSGTLQVRGVLNNPDRVLLPGYFARVRVPVERVAAATLVPDVAIGADQAGRYVLVVNAQDVVEQRAVQTGPLEGSLRVIESGLQPADRVVVDGLQRAVPGEKVAPKTVTMSAVGGPAGSPPAAP